MRTSMAPLMAALLILGGALPAWAQGATIHEGFLCRIDLESAGEVDEEQPITAVHTFDSRKVCTPSATQNVIIECRRQIEDWTGGNVNVNRLFPCLINGSQCGVEPPEGEEFLTATKTMLHINRQGRARLQCQHLRPPGQG